MSKNSSAINKGETFEVLLKDACCIVRVSWDIHGLLRVEQVERGRPRMLLGTYVGEIA